MKKIVLNCRIFFKNERQENGEILIKWLKYVYIKDIELPWYKNEGLTSSIDWALYVAKLDKEIIKTKYLEEYNLDEKDVEFVFEYSHEEIEEIEEIGKEYVIIGRTIEYRKFISPNFVSFLGIVVDKLKRPKLFTEDIDGFTCVKKVDCYLVKRESDNKSDIVFPEDIENIYY